MNNCSLVYLPVEIGKRELMARAFLSSRLAAAGNDVLVFVSDLFDEVGWPGAGVYVGKNVLRDYSPHDLTFYNRMKSSGVEVWYHDEEGGLFPGTTPKERGDYLIRRTDPMVFDENDKILAWGSFQAEKYIKMGVKADVRIVGSANFELYKPEYHQALSEYDEYQTGGLKDYILINTRTCAANYPAKSDVHAINKPPFTDFMEKSERFDRLAHEGVVLYELIGLISEIALKNTGLQIVLRPHPGEDPKFYSGIFCNFGNVLVTGEGDAGPWIRRSRCLIQNGCTTALQATIAQKRVITFSPSGTDASKNVSPFPNEIGAITHTRRDAIDAIFARDVTQQKGTWTQVISSLNTIADITEMVRLRNADERVNERNLARSTARRAWGMRARKVAYRLVPGKLLEHHLREALLDRSFFNRFDRLVATASRHWGAPVTARRLQSDCWRISPATRAEN